MDRSFCRQIITGNVLVSDPNSKGDFDGKQAATPELHQPELVRKSYQDLTPSNRISFEDYLVFEELTDDRTAQNTKELENVNDVLDIQMDDLDALKDVGLGKDSCFHHSNEVLDLCFGSDLVVESSEARQLSKQIDSVSGGNIQRDAEHELQMKEMELEKLIYGSGNMETPSCQIFEEIEEGEISGDAEMADESINPLSEAALIGEETTDNLHASEDGINKDELPFEGKG